MPKITTQKQNGLLYLKDSFMEDAPKAKYIDSIVSSVSMLNDTVGRLSDDKVDILKDSKNIEYVEVDVQVPDPWISGVSGLLNGWTTYNAPTLAYRKNDDGMVEVRISVQNGNNNPIFTLPAAYRPANIANIASWSQSLNLAGHLHVNSTDGIIYSSIASGADAVEGTMYYLASDTTPIPLSCWPIFIKTKMDKPIAVIVSNVEDRQTSLNLPCRSGNVVWETAFTGEARQIKLLNIPWLPYNRKYRVKLLIVGA